MSIITDCPSCQRKLRVPDELVGQKVKCPTCNEIFAVIDEPASEPASASSEVVPSLELDDRPPSPGNAKPEAPQPQEESAAAKQDEPTAPTEDRMACPYCGEQIAANAARCRFCGEAIREEEEEEEEEKEEDDRPWEGEFRPYRRVRRDSEPHRGSLILVLGIVSIVLSATTFLSIIGLPMGIAAWIMGRRDMKKMRANQMDPQGFGSTQAGFICGIIGTVWGSICSLYCLGNLAFMGFFMVGASRMSPVAPPPTTSPIPKKIPAKPGRGAAIPVRFQEYLPAIK